MIKNVQIVTSFLSVRFSLFRFISLWVCSFFLGNFNPILAQKGVNFFEIYAYKDKVEIPFEYVNNLMIVEVKFNGILPLKLVFDTGAEHTILFDKKYTDLLNAKYEEKTVSILGADFQTLVEASIVRNLKISIGNLTANYQSVLVTESDVFNISEYTGTNVQGILGADLFRNMIVKIDYRNGMIYFFTNKNKTFKGFQEVSCTFLNAKPYLNVNVEMENKEEIPLRLLLDTGAALALLIQSDANTTIEIPQNAIKGFVGLGLGGKVEGFLGRVNKLSFNEDINFVQPITNFQVINNEQNKNSVFRQGIVGNVALERLDIVIDYLNGKCFIKPNRSYKREFSYDKSGLILIASGVYFNEYICLDIIKDSPAFVAGIQSGDQLVKINGIHTRFMTLHKIQRKLQGKEGKSIKIQLKRNNQKITVKFNLKKLI